MASNKYTTEQIAAILTDTKIPSAERLHKFADILFKDDFRIGVLGKDNKTLLHCLVSQEIKVDPYIISCLVRVHGADPTAVINQKDHQPMPTDGYPFHLHNTTPLHLAVSYNQTGAVAAFITEKSPVNAQDDKGNTPLDIFLKKNCKVNTSTLSANIETGILLIMSGARPVSEKATLEKHAKEIATEAGRYFDEKEQKIPEALTENGLKNLAKMTQPNTEYAETYLEEQAKQQVITRERSESVAHKLKKQASRVFSRQRSDTITTTTPETPPIPAEPAEQGFLGRHRSFTEQEAERQKKSTNDEKCIVS